MEKVKCPKCGKHINKSGKCITCRNKEILEACIKHNKNIKNHTTALEFENSKYMKKVWKESGLAKMYNPILIILNKEVKTGTYSKEIVGGKQYFSLVEIPKDIDEADEETEELTEKEIKLLEELGVELEDIEEEVKEEEKELEDEDEGEDEEEIVDEEETKPDKIDEILNNDEEQAKKQYEQETGNKVMTTRGTIRQDFYKWKTNNWD